MIAYSIALALVCFIGRIAYRKKDIREEIDLFHKEGGKVSSSPAPTDKVVGRALVAPVPAAPAAQPIVMVVDTTTLGAGPEEPIISEELARRKKYQKGPGGEVRSTSGLNLVGSGGRLVSFQDLEF